MKRFLLLTGAACCLLGFARHAVPVQKIGPTADFKSVNTVSPVKPESPIKTPRFESGDTPFKADFTIAGMDASLVPTATYNFDTGLQGWTVDPTSHVEWSVKQIASPGDAKSFSAIDPADVSSLFVEGDYRVYNREKSAAVSPKLIVPSNGVLTCYVGFTLNYDDYCRLELSLSRDGFESENIVLWNSGNETGERTWYWHPVSIQLDDYVGQEVQFKLLYTWGSADEIFKTGGYMGDFAIDGFQISGRQSVDHIDVMTGEEIHLMDITDAEIVARQWNMPGATPAVSTEKDPTIYYTADGSYDISLTVTDAAGNTSTKTMTDFVTVTGTSPVAKITPPATFRLSDSRLPLVAPLAPVVFRDGSSGFPTSHSWTFTGVDKTNLTYSTQEADPEVSFAFLHNQHVDLESANQHGASTDALDFTVEYEGIINNLLPTDGATNFDMSDWGVFPGSNTHKITAYAERFSKPSRPVMITGAYVFFNNAQAGDLVDQISNVGVHLYTSKDGKPDKCLDSWWWSVYELDTKNSAGNVVGTPFPFTEAPFVDDEFFIVVDGIPTYKDSSNEDGATLVSFLMAPFRSEGNTALFLKDGVWTEASSYFPAGANHTSFYIYPQVYHSVMAPLTDESGEIKVGKEAGSTEFEIFSYLGRTATPEIDCDWLRVTSEPGEYTVDPVAIAYDALPEGINERTGHITLTDGASKLTLAVVQNTTSAKIEVESEAFEVKRLGDIIEVYGIDCALPVSVYSLEGAIMLNTESGQPNMIIDISSWPGGVYILVNGKKSFKIIK